MIHPSIESTLLDMYFQTFNIHIELKLLPLNSNILDWNPSGQYFLLLVNHGYESSKLSTFCIIIWVFQEVILVLESYIFILSKEMRKNLMGNQNYLRLKSGNPTGRQIVVPIEIQI